MKRIIIIVIALLSIVSVSFNIKFYKDLQSSKVLNETIQSELIESDKVQQTQKVEIETLETKLSDSLNNVNRAEENLKLAELEMIETKKVLQDIDDKLEGNGETIDKLDKLLNENEKLKTSIEKLITRIEDLDEQSLIVAEGNTSVEENTRADESDEVTRLNGLIETWIKDIQEAIDFIDNRKTELESASDTLPVLSLERIMINQEIDFLDESMSELKSLKSKMNTFN